MGELQGRIFGGYQLQEEIGSGGVAEVYRARQADGGREVVVKVIFKEFARQPGFAHNIAYVTEASSRLSNHPHILPLVAHGEEGEYIYLVTPYVKDGTLASWIAKGGRLGAADAGPFFQQLCGALSYAHSLGVVHGNIKPSNIFLHEGRHVLLGDFGLLWDVRALDPSWSGNGVEAFEYLAPEVFGGQITQASDMYSLGATLFHALTGHTPFHLNKLSELIAAAQQQRPPSLGHEQPPLAPGMIALDPVVAQAMAKRPEERYASAMLLSQSIDGGLRQVVAQSVGMPQPMGQWQAMPSTPVSAGVFNPSAASSSPAIAPVFGAPPAQPGALAGLLGNDVESGMEAGGAALAGGMAIAPAASNLLDPPTMRVPAPPAIDPPTMRMPASGLGGLGIDLGESGVFPFDGAGQPITAPRIAAGGASSGALSGGFDALQGFESSGLAPFDPPDALLDASIKRISERLPAVQPGGDVGGQSGVFSPTQLGLPRLTEPSLGNVPSNWAELITDESARKRHDPFAQSLDRMAPLDSLQAPSVGSASRASRNDDAGALDHANSWPSLEEPIKWDASTPVELTGDVPVLPPPRRTRPVDEEASERNARPARRQSTPEDEFNDTLHDQKVWTNSHAIAIAAKRLSATPFVVLLLALVLLFELTGFAVTRPDLCVTHACAVVAAQVEKYAPGLRIPGAPAPITFAPSALKLSAMTNGSGSTTLTLTNDGSSAVTWTATTTLGWLTVSPTTGSLAKGAKVSLTLTAHPDGVAPGSYAAGLVVDAATGQSAAPVALTVLAGPVLSATTTKLTFAHCGDTQQLPIANTGGSKLTFTATPSQEAALSVSPNSGTLNPGDKTNLAVTLSCGATQGQSYAVILVSDGGSAQTQVTYGS